ncbi:forkhead box protein N2b isoform X5 [Anguilla anguilla]|uniref:forkhead box protein N2b isoform X5 n=1 Tax=Anguilla anguilla TaxID=7936 RepID=UPI0015A882D0|nr:forkhead box protein N2b isoform X5 [Anguilla anguilla]
MWSFSAFGPNCVDVNIPVPVWSRNVANFVLHQLCLRREDKDPNPGSRVCSCHFVNGERKNNPHIFKRNACKYKASSVLTPLGEPKGREFEKCSRNETVAIERTEDAVNSGRTQTCSKATQTFPQRLKATIFTVDIDGFKRRSDSMENAKSKLAIVQLQEWRERQWEGDRGTAYCTDPPGAMGPIIGMSPDKKAETPGPRAERTGLRALLGAGTLPEAESAASPRATSLDGVGGMVGGPEGGAEDEELTNLNWLHENLLQNFTLGGPEAPPSGSPLFDIEGEGGLPHALCSSLSSSDSPSSSSLSSASLPRGRSREKDPLKSKPPFSFSLLIYMAIEQSPRKSLPVKDIYGWILEHFPYFASAPTGWKNSVRHNLSLNKCFRKVDKSLGKVSGKGSLWCVDPKYRPNLLQALKKQHLPTGQAFGTPPSSPLSASSPPHHLLLRDQCCSVKESDIDAATAMMLLNSAPEHHPEPYGRDGPIDLSQRDLVVVSRDPKQDHNYSSVPQQHRPPRSRSSSLSSLDEGSGRAPRKTHRAGSEGFHSNEDSDPSPDLGPGAGGEAAKAGPGQRGARGRPGRRAKPTPPGRGHAHASVEVPRKRAWLEAKAEVDEELKEAAGSLLHLAGIRTCLEASKRTARSKKLSRK